MSPSDHPKGTRFRPTATVVFALLWVAVLWLGNDFEPGDDAGGQGALALYEPEASAARLIDRDLALAFAAATPNRDQTLSELARAEEPGALWSRLLFPGLAETLERGVAIEEDLLGSALLPGAGVDAGGSSAAGGGTGVEIDRLRVLARLAFLQRLAGRRGEAAETTAPQLPEALAVDLARLLPDADGAGLRFGSENPGAPRIAGGPGAAEWTPAPSAAADPGGLLAAAMRLDPGGTLELEVALLRARAIGRHGEADSLSARQRSLAADQLRRYRALLAVQAMIVVAGLLAALRLADRPRSAAGLHLSEGLGIFVRADLWHRSYYLALAWAGAAGAEAAPQISILYEWGGLLSGLPLIWMIARRTSGASAERDPLGISRRRPGAGGLARVFAVAAAVDLAGVLPLTLLGEQLGEAGHWSEGVDEILLWGSPSQVLATALDYVVWTPLFEELAFRGALFLGLRSRLGFAGAAAVSALAFGSLHFYSLSGALAVTWSGLVWAWAVERSGSVLPAIGAHALYNALFVGAALALYRV